MNFQALAATADGLGAVAADALIVVLPANGEAVTGNAALDSAIAAAVKSGDFERKAGRTIYLHGVAGVKAGRVVLAGAKDSSAKAFRAAVAAALATLKGRSVRHLAVTVAGATPTDSHAETLVLALEQASYTYTHTKPSAEAAPAPGKVSLVAEKAALPAIKAGLQR
ncbi:M17 family peptidase N-terminal domain-containing protein, partial [Ideonella sp.]|uniref:M17 family peptidase N-terminal domain-containing protein n=1 Tax=Ideonella sp. TaxID=1929293 RepID=UPI003BB6BC5C